jgi:hypothetical protein
MPLFQFLNNETGETFEDMMSNSEKEIFLKENTHIVQTLSSPAIGDSVRLGLVKPPNSFRDILRNIKKKHSQGFTRSTINTFD